MTQSLLHRAYGEVGDCGIAPAADVSGHEAGAAGESGAAGVGIADRAIGGQLILFGTIVIDGVEVTVTCPFAGGALRAAWLNGYAAAGNGEVCEAGFFARNEDWEKAFVFGYETAVRVIQHRAKDTQASPPAPREQQTTATAGEMNDADSD